ERLDRLFRYLHPVRRYRLDGRVTDGEPIPVPDGLNPQQCQADAVGAGAHLAGLAAVLRNDRARLRGWAVDARRKQALFDQAAILCPRGQFLADIAAFVPIDAVELVEPGFEQDRFVEHEVAAAVGDTEGQAPPVVLGEIG